MELKFTEAELAFRDEVRNFVRENLPQNIRKRVLDGRAPTKQDFKTWTQILHAKGWSTPHWPIELGGTGWSPIEETIFLDEMQQAGAPGLLPFGVSMVGPVIYTFGSQEQKDRYLPRIASLEDWWCQGFSEPGAGSDLAGLRTQAKREGDEWVINGQKTWTTLGQHADWIFVLARTDLQAAKKQEGISFFLVNMNTPGLTVRPIELIDGEHEVNEVFFDNVRIPLENIVGEENKGWTYAKFLLGNERNGIANVGASKARLRRVRELAALDSYGAGPKINDPLFRARLNALEVDLKVLEVMQLRIISNSRNLPKGQPDPYSSILKIKGSEIQQAATELMMDLTGPYALPYQPYDENDDDWHNLFAGPEWAVDVAPTYFNNRKVTIYGGSNEIQRGILTKAVLGI